MKIYLSDILKYKLLIIIMLGCRKPLLNVGKYKRELFCIEKKNILKIPYISPINDLVLNILENLAFSDRANTVINIRSPKTSLVYVRPVVKT